MNQAWANNNDCDINNDNVWWALAGKHKSALHVVSIPPDNGRIFFYKGSLYWHFTDKKASNLISQSSLAWVKVRSNEICQTSKLTKSIFFLLCFPPSADFDKTEARLFSVQPAQTQGGTVLLFWQDCLVKGRLALSICHCGEIPYAVLFRLYNLKFRTRTNQRCIIKALFYTGFTHSDPVLIFLPLKVAQWSRKTMH